MKTIDYHKAEYDKLASHPQVTDNMIQYFLAIYQEWCQDHKTFEMSPDKAIEYHNLAYTPQAAGRYAAIILETAPEKVERLSKKWIEAYRYRIDDLVAAILMGTEKIAQIVQQYYNELNCENQAVSKNDEARINRLDATTAGWSPDLLRQYMDNATKLADELDDLGLDSTAACQDAADYGQVMIRRYREIDLETALATATARKEESKATLEIARERMENAEKSTEVLEYLMVFKASKKQYQEDLNAEMVASVRLQKFRAGENEAVSKN